MKGSIFMNILSMLNGATLMLILICIGKFKGFKLVSIFIILILITQLIMSIVYNGTK